MKTKKLSEYIDMLEKEGLLVSVRGQAESQESAASAESIEVKDVSYNSILSGEGTLFICKGANFKVQYLKDALKKGAVGLVADSKAPWLSQCGDILNRVPCLMVSDMRRAISRISAMYFDRSWNKGLKLIGDRKSVV